MKATLGLVTRSANQQRSRLDRSGRREANRGAKSAVDPDLGGANGRRKRPRHPTVIGGTQPMPNGPNRQQPISHDRSKQATNEQTAFGLGQLEEVGPCLLPSGHHWSPPDLPHADSLTKMRITRLSNLSGINIMR